MPEFIDPDFAEPSPKRSFSMIVNERFGFVFAKTGSENSSSVLRKLHIYLFHSIARHSSCPRHLGYGQAFTTVDILPANGTVSFYSVYS